MYFTLALLAALGLSGCAQRRLLTNQVLDEARKQKSVEQLRAYVSNRTIASYDQRLLEERRMGREVVDRSERRRLRRTLGRQQRGKIIKVDKLNGQTLLWVSFERTCQSPDCAFGFVSTEDERYRLVQAPVRSGYEAPSMYRGVATKRQKMAKGKLKALSDANAVYKLNRKRKRKRHLSVILELKKQVDDHVDTRREKIRGYD